MPTSVNKLRNPYIHPHGRRREDIDLSFVPASFWPPDDDDNGDENGGGGCPYSVVAAGDGLVCIANTGPGEQEPEQEPTDPGEAPWEPCKFHTPATRYCVVNPATRTCAMLPPVPIHPWLWLPPAAGRITVCGVHPRTGGTGSAPWLVAMYDLGGRVNESDSSTDSDDEESAAPGRGGEWAVAGLGLRRRPAPATGWDHRWLTAPAATYHNLKTHYLWYHGGLVHDQAWPPARHGRRGVPLLKDHHGPVRAPLKDMGHLHGLLGADAGSQPVGRVRVNFRDNAAFVVRYGHMVYLVTRTLAAAAANGDGGGRVQQLPCGVWQLTTSFGKLGHTFDGFWEQVAALDAAQVERLTSWSCVESECEVRVVRVYTVREMLCFQLALRKVISSGGRASPAVVHFVLGLNLDTEAWELLHSEPQVGLYSKVPTALELRPDLFLPPHVEKNSKPKT